MLTARKHFSYRQCGSRVQRRRTASGRGLTVVTFVCVPPAIAAPTDGPPLPSVAEFTMFATRNLAVIFFVANAEGDEAGGAQPSAGPSESRLDGPDRRVSPGRSQRFTRPGDSAASAGGSSPGQSAPAAKSSDCPRDLFGESNDPICGGLCDFFGESSGDCELQGPEAHGEPELRYCQEEATRGTLWRGYVDCASGELERFPECGRAERNVSGALQRHGAGRHRGVHE